MMHQSQFLGHFKRDISAWVVSAFLASCAEQSESSPKMQININPDGVGPSMANTVFESPASP